MNEFVILEKKEYLIREEEIQIREEKLIYLRRRERDEIGRSVDDIQLGYKKSDSCGSGSSSSTSTGNHTPQYETTTPLDATATEHFQNLRDNLAAEYGEEYTVTLTKAKCTIYQGNEALLSVGSDATSVRNLYISLAVCDYDVDYYLIRKRYGEFRTPLHCDGCFFFGSMSFNLFNRGNK